MQHSKLSYWEKQVLIGQPDFIVIGSGIVGLSAALELREMYPSKDIVVLERGMLPAGASTKNAGFACFGSPSEILDDLTSSDEDFVFSTVEKRWLGLNNLRNLIGDESLEYYGWSSYELFRAEDQELFEECRDKLEYLNSKMHPIVGADAVYQLRPEIIEDSRFSGIANAIENRLEGQINTGKMMAAFLAKAKESNITIYNGIAVESVTETPTHAEVHTNAGTFTCAQVLVATNGFAQQFFPEYDVKPARAQVLITKPIDNLKVKGTFHYDKGYYYFRNIDNRVLLGGGRNLDFAGETTTDLTNTTPILDALTNLLQDVILPETAHEVDYCWAGVMGVGQRKMPIVQRHSDRIACGIRLGGMGVAIGSLVGKELAHLVD